MPAAAAHVSERATRGRELPRRPPAAPRPPRRGDARGGRRYSRCFRQPSGQLSVAKRRRAANTPPTATSTPPRSARSASPRSPAVLAPPVGLEPIGVVYICEEVSTPQSAGDVA